MAEMLSKRIVKTGGADEQLNGWQFGAADSPGP